MHPLVERGVLWRTLVSWAQPVDMWRAGGKGAQLLNQTWIQRKGCVNPTEGINSFCLNSRSMARLHCNSVNTHVLLPCIKYAVDGVSQVLFGCRQGGQARQEEDRQFGLELTLKNNSGKNYVLKKWHLKKKTMNLLKSSDKVFFYSFFLSIC